ncbi:hypothetical protein EDB19DRAFT_1728139, partial [Suillus lakei]
KLLATWQMFLSQMNVFITLANVFHHWGPSYTLTSLYHKSLDTPPVRFFTVCGGIFIEIVIAIIYAHSTCGLSHPNGVLLQAFNLHLSITTLFVIVALTVAKPLHTDVLPTTIIAIILWFFTINVAAFIFGALVTVRSNDEQLGSYSHVQKWYESIWGIMWNFLCCVFDGVVLLFVAGFWGVAHCAIRVVQALRQCRVQGLPEDHSYQDLGTIPPPCYSLYDTDTSIIYSSQSLVDAKV